MNKSDKNITSDAVDKNVTLSRNLLQRIQGTPYYRAMLASYNKQSPQQKARMLACVKASGKRSTEPQIKILVTYSAMRYWHNMLLAAHATTFDDLHHTIWACKNQARETLLREVYTDACAGISFTLQLDAEGLFPAEYSETDSMWLIDRSGA